MSFIDFLSFRSFISVPVLIVFYYFGAVVMPFVFFALSKKYRFFRFLDYAKSKQKVYFILSFTFAFCFGELFWRMGFEAIIGYYQMVESFK